MSSTNSKPRTVEEIFNDFKARRAGIIKALTTDVEFFCELCNPDSGPLCLFGFPDETWKVDSPTELVLTELPDPTLVINHSRDTMDRVEWLYHIAIHSDCWLLSMVVYYAAHLDMNMRKELLSMTCDLPTIYQVVAETHPRKDALCQKTQTSG